MKIDDGYFEGSVSQNKVGRWRGFWSISWSTPLVCGGCFAFPNERAAIIALEEAHKRHTQKVAS